MNLSTNPSIKTSLSTSKSLPKIKPILSPQAPGIIYHSSRKNIAFLQQKRGKSSLHKSLRIPIYFSVYHRKKFPLYKQLLLFSKSSRNLDLTLFMDDDKIFIEFLLRKVHHLRTLKLSLKFLSITSREELSDSQSIVPMCPFPFNFLANLPLLSNLELSLENIESLDQITIPRLFRKLEHSSVLTRITLRFEGLSGNLHRLVKQLALGLKGLKFLSWLDLDLHRSALEDRDLQVLCFNLPKSNALEHLGLNLNKCRSLTLESMKSIVYLLKNLQLKSLDLDIRRWSSSLQNSEDLIFQGLCYFLGSSKTSLAFSSISMCNWPSTSLANIFNFRWQKANEIKTVLNLWDEDKSKLVLNMHLSFTPQKLLSQLLSHKSFPDRLKGLSLQFQDLEDPQDLDSLFNIRKMSSLKSLSLKFVHCDALSSITLHQILQGLVGRPGMSKLELSFENCQKIDKKAVKLLIEDFLLKFGFLQSLSLDFTHCDLKDSILLELSELGQLEGLKELAIVLKPKKKEKTNWLRKKLAKKPALTFFSSLAGFRYLKSLTLKLNTRKVSIKEGQMLASSLKGMKNLTKLDLELPFNPKKQDVKNFEGIVEGLNLKEETMFLSLNLTDYYKELRYAPSLSFILRYFNHLYRVVLHFCHAPDFPMSQAEENSLKYLERLLEKSSSIAEYKKDMPLLEYMICEGYRLLALDISILPGQKFGDLGFLVDYFPTDLFKELKYTIKLWLKA